MRKVISSKWFWIALFFLSALSPLALQTSYRPKIILSNNGGLVYHRIGILSNEDQPVVCKGRWWHRETPEGLQVIPTPLTCSYNDDYKLVLDSDCRIYRSHNTTHAAENLRVVGGEWYLVVTGGEQVPVYP